MDAEEEQPTRETPPPDGEEGRATTPLVLSPRPLPDVVFGAVSPPPPPSRPSPAPRPAPPVLPGGEAAGPGEITGPQPVVGPAAFPQPAAAVDRGRRTALLVAVALVGALVVGLVAVALWPSSSDSRVRQSAPELTAQRQDRSAAPRGGTPAAGEREEGSGRDRPSGPAASQGPGAGAPAGQAPQETPAAPAQETSPVPPQAEPPVAGTTDQGVQVGYRTVEVAAGYFEGELTLTNGTGAPLESWTVSFAYPGALIRNVWGGLLGAQGGTVTITGDEETAPIAAGASVTVRFGGSGLPSRPRSCLLNGRPCGF